MRWVPGLFLWIYGASYGYLDKFDLKYYQPGLILMSPEKTSPDAIPQFKEQKKLFSIFAEYKNGEKYLVSKM